MKVINVDAFGDLTVDSTMITVDNSIITVDTTEGENILPIEIVLVPRETPVTGDELVLYIRRELTDDEYNVVVSWNYVDSYLHIYFHSDTIPNENGSKYEIILKNNNVNIYRGKMVLLSATESVQDYKTTEVVNKKLKF